MPHGHGRDWIGWCALALLPLVGGCQSPTGHLNLLGYTSKPNYDEKVHTVYVPMFENHTVGAFRRGIEVDLTRAVVREIETRTPYKVVHDRSRADTELCGTITTYQKNLVNRNQLNEVREAETILKAKVVWKDLRTGEVLSQARPGPRGPIAPPFDPDNPPPPILPAKPEAVEVTSVGRMLPEVGESNATALKMNIDRMAVQIVGLMEKPW
jgi:hypothetical protein